MTRSLQERPNAFAGRRFRNTAELSGELSVGDVVAVAADGEVRLAVAKAGWTPVPGPLTEVRTSQHGTRPLPSRSSRLPDTADCPAIPCPDEGAT
jgi:hypothetical protein